MTHAHEAQWVFDDLAHDGGVAAQRFAAHRGQQAVGRACIHDGDELAFVGHVQRVQPQQLAGAADLGLYG